MPIPNFLLPLNPDVEKNQYLFLETNIETKIVDEDIYDYSNTYFITKNDFLNPIDKIKQEVIKYFESNDEDLKISAEVYNQSINIINSLYPSIYEQLEIENIYTSNYGTLIFDWEKPNKDLFSLEIGSNTLGYFIEVSGSDVKQVEEINIDEEFEKSTLDLLNDLSVFIEP